MRNYSSVYIIVQSILYRVLLTEWVGDGDPDGTVGHDTVLHQDRRPSRGVGRLAVGNAVVRQDVTILGGDLVAFHWVPELLDVLCL